MAVTEADVLKIADLARLRLDPARIPHIVGELNGILAHMDALQSADTSGVTPVAGVGGDGTPLRGDAVAPPPMKVSAPGLAAESRDGFILVPRLSTHEAL